MHPVASFQVKNNGPRTVLIAMSSVPDGLDSPVKVLPGETSLPFTFAADYTIEAEVVPLIFPKPGVYVAFTPENLNTKVIGPAFVNVDIIANLNFLEGDPVLPSHTIQKAHYF